jgi:hypothetical protein
MTMWWGGSGKRTTRADTRADGARVAAVHGLGDVVRCSGVYREGPGRSLGGQSDAGCACQQKKAKIPTKKQHSPFRIFVQVSVLGESDRTVTIRMSAPTAQGNARPEMQTIRFKEF